MRNKVNWKLGACLLVASSLTTAAFSDTKADVLSLTGNRRAKLVWIRFPWCDSSYAPVKAYRGAAEANEGSFTQLVTFDTDAGVERYLDKNVGCHMYPRFTRKDGSRVIWTDTVTNCAWIAGYSGTPTKTKLIDGGDYPVVHSRYDSATGKEYVYTLSEDNKRLSLIPLNSDYTADMNAKTVVYTATAALSTSMGVSADGRYFSTFMPWPSTMIVDLVSGTKYDRHIVDDAFGCQPNMAPDNSYRFFYLRSDHLVIRMWGPALTAENWDVVVYMMPGNTDFNKGGYYHDCVLPRWTNNPLFFTNSYPLVMWNYSDGRIFDYSADQLKSDQLKDSCGTGVFCLGKLTADYKTVEKYVRITTCDVRKRDVVGDGWISSTASGIGPRDIYRTGSDAAVRLTVQGHFIAATTSSWGTVALTLIGPSGRVVLRSCGSGTVKCSLGNLPAGVYLARVSTAAGSTVSRLMTE